MYDRDREMNQADAEPSVEDVVRAKGYTRAIIASNAAEGDLYLWVKPEADLSERFKAYDEDADEWIKVPGWLFEVEDR